MRTATTVKEKMVTRTIITRKLNVMVVDTESMSIESKEVIIPDGINPNLLNKYVTDRFLAPTERFVQITSEEVVETLYGMPESTFLRHARILPPRGTKETD